MGPSSSGDGSTISAPLNLGSELITSFDSTSGLLVLSTQDIRHFNIRIFDQNLSEVFVSAEPPSKPSNLKVSFLANGDATVSWNLSTGATGYVVQADPYYPSYGPIYRTTAGSNQSSITIRNLPLINYRSISVAAFNQSTASSQVWWYGTAPKRSGAPDGPGKIYAQFGDGDLTISWDSVARATSYWVYLFSENGEGRYREVTKGVGSFTFQNIDPNDSYFLSLTAENDEGSSWLDPIEVEQLTNPQGGSPWPDHGNFIDDSPKNAEGWQESSWLGEFFALPEWNGWVLHRHFGDFYPVGDDDRSWWMYSIGLEWIWTNGVTFPFFYMSRDDTWAYYLPKTSEPRWLFRYSDGQWITF